MGNFSGIKSNFTKFGQAGQSTVEYILLFVVVTALVSLVFKSDQFEKLFGKNGKFADVYKREMEFSYRHGFSGRTPFKKPDYTGKDHESYNKQFFGAKVGYPQ